MMGGNGPGRRRGRAPTAARSSRSNTAFCPNCGAAQTSTAASNSSSSATAGVGNDPQVLPQLRHRDHGVGQVLPQLRDKGVAGMNCPNCGTQLPDGAAFCYKCGSSVAPRGGAQPGPQGSQAPSSQQTSSSSSSAPVIAPAGATALKCPSCGAPISPKFGEMVITCEYCGTSITLGNQGWKDIQKHTMLPLNIHRGPGDGCHPRHDGQGHLQAPLARGIDARGDDRDLHPLLDSPGLRAHDDSGGGRDAAARPNRYLGRPDGNRDWEAWAAGEAAASEAAAGEGEGRST